MQDHGQGGDGACYSDYTNGHSFNNRVDRHTMFSRTGGCSVISQKTRGTEASTSRFMHEREAGRKRKNYDAVAAAR